MLYVAGNFDTVVLDDWHLADDASRALMGFIAERQRDAAGGPAVREIHVQRPEWLSADTAARQQALQQAAGAHVLRLAPLDGPIPSNDPLKPLLGFGLRLQGETPPRRVEALLDLDGPSTARLVVYLTSAANQAIANALKAAR